jgi:hypothetical protein
MNDELHEILDGERPVGEVSAALRAEAEAWDRLLENVRQDVPGPAPTWLEGRIMDEVRSLARSSERGEVGTASADRDERIHWLLRRRTLRASPLGFGLAAAAVLALAVGPWILGRQGGDPVSLAAAAGASPDEVDAVVYIQFVLEAPGASSVAVSGDFNEWDRTVHRLEDLDGDGVWSGRIAIAPGIHEYMFVVDGDRWVTDPRAERYTDDGFGNRNALLAVPGPGRI